MKDGVRAAFTESYSCGLGVAMRVRSFSRSRNSHLTKHVVATGTFAKDAGSTPAASSLRPAERGEGCLAEAPRA